ncbi:MAG: iron-sulfur cluster assembly scaffold protein [Deltaproteobacteria bacterium]|nr:iron-sulfur cluster assembly scaffold protein [Deltaproteobacteria bacterium]
MSQCKNISIQDPESLREMLSLSGYADKAIDYFINKTNMGTLPDADQVTELTGPCGDTMRIYLKLEDGRINDAKIQVLGCPAAIASAMATIDYIKGMTLEEALKVQDRDIFRMLEALPDQKQHCIRLTIKTLQKAIDEYGSKDNQEGE